MDKCLNEGLGRKNFFVFLGPGVGPKLCTYMLSMHCIMELHPPDKCMRECQYSVCVCVFLMCMYALRPEV